MAYWIAGASGNFATSSTWQSVDSTSLLDSESSNNGVGGVAYSSTFTPGSITIDGIAIKLQYVNTSPTGTITVELYNNTLSSLVSGASTTINVSDLPPTSTDSNKGNEGGWVFFKFASSVTLLVANAYQVGVATSNGGQVNLYTNGTSNNWSRMLRTTTTGSPTTGDAINVLGEMTGAGTYNTRTVTMNNTTSTEFGLMCVGQYGIITWGTTASTNYLLILENNLIIYNGGTFSMGTSGTVVPSTSTASLKFDASGGSYGINVRNGGTFNAYGATKGTVNTTLNGDVSANATTFIVTANTNWSTSDVLAIASTTQTASQSEKVTIASQASQTITIGTGGGSGGNSLKYAHGGGGTSQNGLPITAEVINLTRNVVVTAYNTSYPTYVYVNVTAVINAQYAEFSYLGINTQNYRGIEFNSTGTSSIEYCSIHDCVNWGTYIANNYGVNSNNLIYSYNVHWNNDSNSAGSSLQLDNNSSSNITINNNVWVGCGSSSNGNILNFVDTAVTFENNIVAGSGNGSGGRAIHLNASGPLGTFSGNSGHSNAGRGITYDTNNNYGTIEGGAWWRNGSYGCQSEGSGQYQVTWDTIQLFGNGNGVNFRADGNIGRLTISNCTIDSDSIYSTSVGIGIYTSFPLYIINCLIGTNTTHSTGDLDLGSNQYNKIFVINSKLGSSTQVNNYNGQGFCSSVNCHRLGQTTVYKSFVRNGIIVANTSIVHTGGNYSWQMIPNSSSYNLILPGPEDLDTFKFAVNANTQVTIKCWVYYDTSYNGSMPQLILKGGMVQGISSDVTATTPSGNSGIWQQLTVQATPTETTAVEAIVSCNGTAGNVYIEDFTVTQP